MQNIIIHRSEQCTDAPYDICSGVTSTHSQLTSVQFKYANNSYMYMYRNMKSNDNYKLDSYLRAIRTIPVAPSLYVA